MANSEASLLIKIKQIGAESLGTIKSGLADIAKLAATTGAALVAGVAYSIKAFKEQEASTNALNKALVQQGIYTPELSKSYLNMASALQKVSIFGDETIVKAQAQLQSYLGQIPITEKLMKATLDLAQAQGIDLVQAANLVGKSIGTNTNALGRQGIEIDATASKTEKLAAVVDGLNSKFGGQAEAATQGLGALDQMANSLSDVAEIVGEYFAPYVSAAAKQITQFSTDLQTNQGFLSGLTEVALFAAKTFSVLKNSVVGVAEVIGTGLAASIESMSLLITGNFSAAKEMAELGMSEVGTIIKTRAQTTVDEINAIDALQSEVEAEKKANEEVQLKNSWDRKNQIVRDAKAKEATDMITAEQMRDAKLLGIQLKTGMKSKELQEMIDQAKETARKSSLDTIAGLQSSNSKELNLIGKAAGIASIAIDTPVAISKALAAFPPPANFIAAGLVGVAMAAQAARIAGVQLAAGGIVSATQGGVPAILGEAGRDEAVVPLDGSAGGFGTTINITVMGGMLGDPQSAKEFARAVDNELFNLRKNNESVAFDSGVA